MNPQWTGAAAIAAAIAMIVFLLSTDAAFAWSQCGKATWYEAGGLTASGEEMTADALTAAHATLPFGTQIEVENLTNGRTAIARVNDRGQFTNDRIVGVSRAVPKSSASFAPASFASGSPLSTGMCRRMAPVRKIRKAIWNRRTKSYLSCVTPRRRRIRCQPVLGSHSSVRLGPSIG